MHDEEKVSSIEPMPSGMRDHSDEGSDEGSDEDSDGEDSSLELNGLAGTGRASSIPNDAVNRSVKGSGTAASPPSRSPPQPVKNVVVFDTDKVNVTSKVVAGRFGGNSSPSLSLSLSLALNALPSSLPPDTIARLVGGSGGGLSSTTSILCFLSRTVVCTCGLPGPAKVALPKSKDSVLLSKRSEEGENKEEG